MKKEPLVPRVKGRSEGGEASVEMFPVKGARLAYEITGEGPLFVQMHGLTSSAWREHRVGLDMTGNLHGYRVLRFDARGHGSTTGSAVPSDYLWAQLGEDLLALLDHVAPGEQVHTAGPSMAAATQLYAALADPARFATLTLTVPPTAWKIRAAQADSYRESADLVENHGIGAFIRVGGSVLPPPALADKPQERVPSVSQELLPSIFRGASQTDLPDAELLKNLTNPTQILAWVDDSSHPVETAEKLHRILAQSQLSIAETPEDLRTWPDRVARFVRRYPAKM